MNAFATIYAYKKAVVLAFICTAGLAALLFHTRLNDPELLIETESAEVLIHAHKPEDTHYDHMAWAKGVLVVPKNMWVTSVQVNVRDAPGNILHNAYITVQNTSDEWCPNNPRAIWSGGTVTAKKATKFQEPYGIYLEKGQTLTLEAALHNGNTEGRGTDYHNVVLEAHLAYVHANKKSLRTTPLYFALIDPSGCDKQRPIFTIPPAVQGMKFSSNDRPFIFNDDADIFFAGGHFHGSYESDVKNTVRLFLNDTLLDEFTTTNIKDDAARNPRLLAGKEPVHVKTGDRLWMEAVFDNPSKEPVYEGMAIVGFYYSVR